MRWRYYAVFSNLNFNWEAENVTTTHTTHARLRTLPQSFA